MADILQYVGARYVPVLFSNPDGSNEWAANTTYEPLTIVTYNNGSFTSKTQVPPTVGNPVDNPQYWVQTGNYNAQIEQISDSLSHMTFIYPEQYGAIGDGIHDDTGAIQEALNTGKTVIFNKRYKVTAANSAALTSKKVSVNYALNVLSGQTIIVNGTFIIDSGIIFYSKNTTDIAIKGGTYLFGHANSSLLLYGQEVVCLDTVERCSVSNIITDESAVFAVNAKYITVMNCIGYRNSVAPKNPVAGLHVCYKCSIENCSVLGSCNDGDILLFTCRECKVLNCTLISDYYSGAIDPGAQGICIDTACHNILVSGNMCEGYYHAVDIKSDARGVVASSNVLNRNKCSITVRKGEQTGGQLNSQNNVLITGNSIDMSGNTALTPIPGSAGLYSSDIIAAGVYVTDSYSVKISDNIITSSKSITGFGVFIWNCLDKITVSGNSFEVRNEKSSSFISGAFIGCNSPALAEIIISNNVYRTWNNGDNICSFALLKGASIVKMDSNDIFSGLNPISLVDVPLLLMCGNNIRNNANYFISGTEYDCILVGNIFYMFSGASVTNINRVAGISRGNVVSYLTGSPTTGCKISDDTVAQRT